MAPLFETRGESNLKALFTSHSSASRYKWRWSTVFLALRSAPAAAALFTMQRFLLPPRPASRALWWLSALALGLSLWGAVLLALPSGHAGERDHELARQALQQGKVLPLRTVLDQAERDYQGQVIKVEFEHDDGQFVYELRVLQSSGQLLKLKINAVNGQVIKVSRKGRD